MKAEVQANTSACQNETEKQRPLGQDNIVRSRETTLNTVTETVDKNQLSTVVLGVHSMHTDRNCLYTKVQFKEKGFRFLVDTGSPVSIISYVDFQNLDIEGTSLQSIDTNLISS